MWRRKNCKACGARLAQIGDDIRTEMRALTGEMDALLGGVWQGNAADGFAQGWQQWEAGAREVLQGLADMGQLLGETGRSYTSMDDSSAGTIGQSGDGL
jgi:WXG100 family type VII secretion target